MGPASGREQRGDREVPRSSLKSDSPSPLTAEKREIAHCSRQTSPPSKNCLDFGGLEPQAIPGVFSSHKSTTSSGSDFRLIWIKGGLLTSSPAPEFGDQDPEGGASSVPLGWSAGPSLDCSPRPLRHRLLWGTYLPSESRWRTSRTPERTQEHLWAPAPAWRGRGGPSGGRAGEVRVVPSTLVTRSGRAPRGRAPEEEEGIGGAGGSGTRATLGARDRERRAGPAGARAECVSPCDLAPGPDWGGGRLCRPGREESSPSGCERAAAGIAVGLAGGRVSREAPR